DPKNLNAGKGFNSSNSRIFEAVICDKSNVVPDSTCIFGQKLAGMRAKWRKKKVRRLKRKRKRRRARYK
ncbi:MAG: hypothetical protein ACE5NN_02310, partial [Candidatus Bathyarchaeia archaeon]